MAEEAQARSVAEHIERGLERYGRGELVAAIVEWEAALKLDPANLRARQYIQYVRENFEALADQFGRVVQSDGGALPVETRKKTAPGMTESSNFNAAFDALASGWDLDEFVPDELPPPPAAAPEPTGIEVAPPVPDAAGDALGEDLAAVAQAVLDPFGLAMTPPHGAHVLEEEPGTSGSMEALGVRPLDAEPLQGLEPGLDLERTRPHLSSRLPKTRVPLEEEKTIDRNQMPEESTIDRSEAGMDTARTTERGGFGQRGGDWLRGEGSNAPVELERPPEPEMPAAEDDFSDLIDEAPEDRIKTQTKVRQLIGETPGRKISEGPDGELVVEFEAELPDEYARSMSHEFQIDLASLEGQEGSGQLENEPPTLSRRKSSPDMAPPAVDDSLLGTVDLDGPPAPIDKGRRPSFPELEVLPDPVANNLTVTLPTPDPPPLAHPEPPKLTLVPPPPPEPEPEAAPPPVQAKSAPPDVFAVADAPMVPPEIIDTPVDASSLPVLERSSRFEHEHTPLPEPYDPEALEDEFDAASQKGTTPIPRTPSEDDAPALTGIAATVQTHLLEAKKCFERGELAAAAQAANEAFACDLEGEAASIRDAERQLLIRIFETQLGSLKRVPQVSVSPAEISQLGLDHRFGFMLSLIDGNTTFDDLLDIAGMPRIEAFRILESLLRQGVISA